MLIEVKLDWKSSENDQIHFNILSYGKWLESHTCKYSIRSDSHFALNREVIRVNHWNSIEYYFCVWWLPVIVYINTNAHVILTYSFPYDLEDSLFLKCICWFIFGCAWAPLGWGVWASHCSAFSCFGALTLGKQASMVVAHRF